MDKMDCAIVDSMLRDHQAFSAIEGATRRRICDGLDVNCRTLHRRLAAMVEMGWLARGVMEGQMHTYYVTEAGVRTFEGVLE